MSAPWPAYRATAAAWTMLCQDRAEAAAVLLEHGLDRDEATGLLDFAGLNGDGQTTRARVCFGGDTWVVDLFGQREAATRAPLWAAAEKAYAEGRLKPLPRMPSVRPESDYEMHLPEEGA